MNLKERMHDSDLIFEETGHYQGLLDLQLKRTDPLRYESLHLRLRSAVVSARETAKKIAASPGVREVGEMVVALYTPEGDAIALSNGIMVHVHTCSRFIKWMIENEYEDNPGIEPGDIFANNDAYIGTVQVPDVMDVVPIFHDGELVGWVGTVCHELEVGGITPGGDVVLAQDRFSEGMFVCAEKIGRNDEIRRDYIIRCERNLRMPHYWILDEKAKVSACIEVRERVLEIISTMGLDYYQQATKEAIEEGRRAQLDRMRMMSVPGRYRGVSFFGYVIEGKPGILPKGAKDLIVHIPMEVRIDKDGLMEIDFEGTGSPGDHSMNATPAAMDGGLFVTLTQSMNYDGKVNDGAWMATKMILPYGSWCNPDSHFYATATSWVGLVPSFGIWQRLLSRSFQARGFLEEVFIGQVNSPMIEMGGIDQYGSRFGSALFECAAAGSGARGTLDGIDTGYCGWNPESDMGNVEIWEQTMPMLWMGRTNLVDSGGAGKYRGGIAFASLWRIHRTPDLSVYTSEHSARLFDNAGMCGGYPAPTAIPHYVARDVGDIDLIQNQMRLPHGLGADPDKTEMETIFEDRVEVVEGPFVQRPLEDGDYFSHTYNAGGGYGDVLDRDPASIIEDIREGKVSEWAAEHIYKIVLQKTEHGLSWKPDATEQLRREARQKRLEESVPTADWIAASKDRVIEQDFAIEVTDLYRDCMARSDQFAAEFRDFWGLESDFTFAPVAKPAWERRT
jgi:acetone carboxylase alpha subunit